MSVITSKMAPSIYGVTQHITCTSKKIVTNSAPVRNHCAFLSIAIQKVLLFINLPQHLIWRLIGCKVDHEVKAAAKNSRVQTQDACIPVHRILFFRKQRFLPCIDTRRSHPGGRGRLSRPGWRFLRRCNLEMHNTKKELKFVDKVT